MHRVAIILLLAAATVQGQKNRVGADLVNASAQGQPPTTVDRSAVDEGESASRWFGRIGVIGVVYHPRITFAVGGDAIPNASANVSNNVTVTLDIGYDVTKNISTQIMLGIPSRPILTGSGTVAQLGELGAVRYGPGVFSGLYQLRRWHRFQPYLGPGIAYAIILKDHDAAVSDLHAANNFGAVVQTGAEYKLGGRWSIFGDLKELWLAVNAHGLINGTIPVTPHAPLNPSIVTAGVKFYFSRKLRQSPAPLNSHQN